MTAHLRRGLVADIGGTHARFAWVDLSVSAAAVQQVQTLKTADYSDPLAAIEHYLAQQGLPITALGAVLLAVAGPVRDNRAQLTNNTWMIDGAQLSTALSQRTQQRVPVHCINDFSAQAYALAAISPQQCLRLGDTPGAADQGPKLITGPGTGLGVATLITATDGRCSVLPSEGGHIAFAPAQPEEIDLLNWLWKQGLERVSYEHLLSGSGLKRLYQYQLSQQRSAAPQATYSAAQITQAALTGEPVALQALTRFCTLLGRFAGEMALVMGATGGVYIGGGIVPRIADSFPHAAFRAGFEAKGVMTARLQPIPTYLVQVQQPGLLGAAVALAQLPNGL